MKTFLLGSFVLSICFITEALGHLHESSISDIENQEVVYRVSRGLHGKKKDSECRYKKEGPWSDCDSSHMQKKTLNLKKGESSCDPTKVITRKCKETCKYDKGEWSECDLTTHIRNRVDVLITSKSHSSCQYERVQTKKCKKVCKYNKQSSWSECDSTGKKTKVLPLKFGNALACLPNKTITRPCHKGSRRSSHKVISKGRGKGDDLDEDD